MFRIHDVNHRFKQSPMVSFIKKKENNYGTEPKNKN